MKAYVYTFKSCETALQQVCEALKASYEIKDSYEWPGTQRRPRISVVITIDKAVSLALGREMKQIDYPAKKDGFVKMMIENRKQEIDMEFVGESEFDYRQAFGDNVLSFCKNLSSATKAPEQEMRGND